MRSRCVLLFLLPPRPAPPWTVLRLCRLVPFSPPNAPTSFSVPLAEGVCSDGHPYRPAGSVGGRGPQLWRSWRQLGYVVLRFHGGEFPQWPQNRSFLASRSP